MASKIDNQTPLPGATNLAVGRSSGRVSAEQGEAPAASTAASDDSLQLSGEAAGLLSAQKTAASAPSIDQAKIDALRASISAGTYQINPQEIASRLIALERKLA